MVRLPHNLIPWPWRSFEVVYPECARRVITSAGERLTQVCSTQYLGLPWNQAARNAAEKALAEADLSYWGSLGSNYLGGTHPERLLFEQSVADVCKREAGLAFASGWAGNYAIGEVLGRVCDLVISDRRNHNSLIHGLRAARAAVIVVDSLVDDASVVLAEHSWKRAAVVFPSVEGITGECVELNLTPRWRRRTLVVVDECHSFGVVGRDGFEEVGSKDADLRIVGFSKGFGTMGAVVCGRANVIDMVAQVASPWIFSTAVPPIIWRINRELVGVVASLEDERMKVNCLAARFREQLLEAAVAHSGARHITGIRLAGDVNAPRFEAFLRSRGFFVKASRFPSRPRGAPCARIAFTPMHDSHDVDELAIAIRGAKAAGLVKSIRAAGRRSVVV